MTTCASFQFGRFVFEHIDKQAANNFAFLFGFTDTRQLAQEQIAGIDAYHARMQFAFKHFHDHVAFVQAQQPVVYKNASELIANGAVNQGRSHRRIDAARQSQNNFFIAHLLANFGDGFFNVIAHDPVWAGFAYVQHKAVEQGLTLNGMCHFWVKLHRIKTTRFIGHSCDGASRRRGHHFETLG